MLLGQVVVAICQSGARPRLHLLRKTNASRPNSAQCQWYAGDLCADAQKSPPCASTPPHRASTAPQSRPKLGWPRHPIRRKARTASQALISFAREYGDSTCRHQRPDATTPAPFKSTLPKAPRSLPTWTHRRRLSGPSSSRRCAPILRSPCSFQNQRKSNWQALAGGVGPESNRRHGDSGLCSTN